MIDESLAERFAGEWLFMTVLRDPVERWFSCYFYTRFKQSEHFRVSEELDTFVHSEMARAYGSTYVRHLACVRYDQDASTSHHIAHACNVLERFTLLGDVGELPAFFDRFGEIVGVRLRMDTANSSPASLQKQRAILDDALPRKVEELCAPDMAVYHHATRLMRQPLGIGTKGPCDAVAQR